MQFISERNKFNPQHESPLASFVRGLHATTEPSTRLDAIGRVTRQLRPVCALALVVLLVPMTTAPLLGQSYAPPPPQQQQAPPPPPPQDGQNGTDSGPGAPPNNEEGVPPGEPQGQPMSPDELNQLVAPIALYPDALVAQILAASTYPSQVVEADRWVQSQGNVSAEQLGAEANGQNWDPSVKALVAFPSVLAQMDKNIQWTTDLGNAYYNQPDDVMSAVQAMRGRAQSAGSLQNTSQLQVSDDNGYIAIAPSNPDEVYVPYYDPWLVYGSPVAAFPGYYYGPPAGVYFGSGLAIGFGIGIGIGVFSRWGWGYHHWNTDWRNRHVRYDNRRYYTHSRTVVNRGWNRPGGAQGRPGSRGANYHGGSFNRGNVNHGSRNVNRGNQHVNRGVQNANRGENVNRNAQHFNRGTQPGNRERENVNRGNQRGNQEAQHSNRGNQQVHSEGRSSGGGRAGGGHSGGGHDGGHRR